MRIRVLTGYNDAFLPIAKLTVPLLRDFAARHGHDFHVATDMDAGALNTIWAKIPLIQKALENGPEFVFWIDSDALMLRPERDIRDSIADHADLHMTWHGPDTGRLDWHESNPHYNAGVMLVRNSAWSRDFFARVWSLRFPRLVPGTIRPQSSSFWDTGKASGSATTSNMLPTGSTSHTSTVSGIRFREA